MKHLKTSVPMNTAAVVRTWERIRACNANFSVGQGDQQQKFRERDQSNGQL